MTTNKNTGRKTKSIVRMPATKCAHLKKRLEQRRLHSFKVPRGRGG